MPVGHSARRCTTCAAPPAPPPSRPGPTTRCGFARAPSGATRSPSRRRALAAYRNAFLAGVHVPEVSAELEHWIEQTRARLHQAAGRAAAALSLQAEQAGDLGRAVEAARAALDLHPDDEACARRLMRLLDRCADRTQALQIYYRLA